VDLLTLDSFATPRLRAERLTAGHRDEIARMHQDAAVMEHLGGVRDAAQTDEYLERNLAHWDRYGFGLWILRGTDGGEMIGRAVLRHLAIGDGDEIETGYAFYQPYWGRGLATEVARTCVAMGFEILHADSIVGLTLPGNHASQRVLMKAGMSRDREVEHAGSLHVLLRVTRPAWAAAR